MKCHFWSSGTAMAMSPLLGDPRVCHVYYGRTPVCHVYYGAIGTLGEGLCAIGSPTDMPRILRCYR